MNRRAGFSLVEALCAIFILGVGLVGITEGITIALGASRESEVEARAALLAAGRIEELIADGFITDGEEEGDFGDAFPHLKYRQTVRASSPSGLHEVTVAVVDSRSPGVLCELKTLLFDPPWDDLAPAAGAGSGAGTGRKNDRYGTSERRSGRERGARR